LLRIVLDDGTPAPAGAVVSIEGDKETFYVARRGEAYVTGLEPSSRVSLAWNGERCALRFTLPPPKGDEIPRVGPVACHGVKP
jgi:outer membrane usher protein